MKLIKYIFILFLTYSFSIKAQIINNVNYKDLTNVLAELKSNTISDLRKLKLINYEINIRENYLNTLKRNVTENSKLIKSKEKQIKTLNEAVENQKKEYEEIIYYAYKTRKERNKAIFIFSSITISEAFKRFNYLKFMEEYLSYETKNLESNINLLKEEKQKIINIKNENNALNENLTNELIILNREKRKQNQIIERLNKKKEEVKRDNKKNEEKNKQLEKERIKENPADSNNPKSKEFLNQKGKLPMPVTGLITEKFGKHKHPALKNVFIENDGIGISTVQNNVKAVYDGVVSKTLVIPGGREALIIKHGEFYTVYSNLKDLKFTKNQKVRQGDIVGNVFTEGKEKDIVNFQIWYKKENLNPEEWIKK